MRQKITKSTTPDRELSAGRVKWSSVREKIADRYQHDPAYRAGWDKTARRHALASKIRTLRQERGLSQQELARRVGTSQAAIARLELGGAEPRLETLERIAEAFDMNLALHFEPRKPGVPTLLTAD